VFDKRSNYETHINRKFPCGLPLSEALIIPPKITETLPKILIAYKSNEETYKCNYCTMSFSRKDNLSRHLKNICKIKKADEASKEDIFKKLLEGYELLKKENQEMKKKITVLETKSTTTTNNIEKQQINNTTIDKQQINNNIKLIAFGKEDLSYITDSVSKEILKKGYQTLPYLIEYAHFNEEKPEYHNIYKPNIKSDKVMAYDGDNWNLHFEEDIMDKLKGWGCQYIDEKFKDLVDKKLINEAAIKKLKRFIENRDDEPQKTILDNDIKLILYNKRNIVKATKEKIRKAKLLN
jgi:hypothetical protein